MGKLFFDAPEVEPEVENNSEYSEQLNKTVTTILEGEPELVQAEIKALAEEKGISEEEAQKELTPEIEKQIVFLQRQIDKLGGKVAVENAKKITRLREALDIDLMTGLLNKSGFEKRGVQEIIDYERYGRKNAEVILVMVDISNFKMINDVDGHKEGDRIIIELGEIFKDTVREADFVGHYGGDEFVIGITHFSDKSDEVRKFLERIQKAIKTKLKRQDGSSVEVSLGSFSTADINDDDWENLNNTDLRETKERPGRKAQKIYDHMFKEADKTMEMVKIFDDPKMNSIAVFDDIKNVNTDSEEFFVLQKLRHKKRDLNDILIQKKRENETEEEYTSRIQKEYQEEREKVITTAKQEFANL